MGEVLTRDDSLPQHEKWRGWNRANLRHLLSTVLVLTLGIVGR